LNNLEAQRKNGSVLNFMTFDFGGYFTFRNSYQLSAIPKKKNHLFLTRHKI